MKTLKPNFFRSTGAVLFWMIVLSGITYFWQGYHEGKWWDSGYLFSLLIPFAIAAVAVWLLFVPKGLSYSETEFAIHSALSGPQNFTWNDLEYYGKGNNVFMIQFEGQTAFQIFAQAYPKKEWTDFIHFLQTTFPEKKASGYLGVRMFKWGKKS